MTRERTDMQPSHPRIYDTIGHGYRNFRVPDPRIGQAIRDALGDATTICNVGAGAGSYEPTDLDLVAVEPSPVMVSQRSNVNPVVRGQAESLPFGDNTFDASMAILSVHHWVDQRRGLSEMKRVSDRQVLLTFDPELVDRFWLVKDYLPELKQMDRDRTLPLAEVARLLDARSVEAVLIPWDCTDGFQAAYWRRPESYLDPHVRAAISSISQLPKPTVSRAIEQLEQDLKTGRWHQRYETLLSRQEMDFGYRLVVAG